MWFRWPDSDQLSIARRGRFAEVDYFNGYIVKNVMKYCPDVSVNSTGENIIHEIEINKGPLAFNNFNNHVFDGFY